MFIEPGEAKKIFGGMKLKTLGALLLAGAAGLLATGCRTYQQQNKVIADWRQGNLPKAVLEAGKLADANAQKRDAVIWRLEHGAVLRAAGQYADSNRAFDEAQAKIDDYAQKAKIRLGQETGALLSNQATLAYEGRAYDGILLNTYKALNYLALGEPDKARPELIHAYQRQQDAVEANKKRIAETRDAAQKNKDRAAVERTQSNTKLQSDLAAVSSNLDSVGGYADYVNPFTVYLDGLYFLANAADASDRERARKSLERAHAFAPGNNCVKQDLADAEALLEGKPLRPVTYVIFETGGAPERDQIRIDIPTFWRELPYLGAAFPILKLQDNYVPSLTVSASNLNATSTALLASMDRVIGLDFKNELPLVITKTLVSTTIKAVATHYAWEATRNKQADGSLDNGGIAGALVIISCVAWCAANNIADERTWTTLPKEFQVARVPTPADRRIDLTAPNGLKTSVVINDGTVNVVYVKSVNLGTPLLVSQFKLK